MSGGAGAGSAIQGFGAIYGGYSKEQAYNKAAGVEDQNAVEATNEGLYGADKQGRIGEQREGKIQTGYAASGVTQSSGSAMAVLASAAANSEIDKQNVLHGAQLKALNYINQANMDAQAGEQAMTAGIFNAAGAGATAAGTVGSGSSNQSGNYVNDYSADDDGSGYASSAASYGEGFA